jgi:hypothetical protein
MYFLGLYGVPLASVNSELDNPQNILDCDKIDVHSDKIESNVDNKKDIDYDKIEFGPACTAAAKWLYAPAASKQALVHGYPVLCLKVCIHNIHTCMHHTDIHACMQVELAHV